MTAKPTEAEPRQREIWRRKRDGVQYAVVEVTWDGYIGLMRVDPGKTRRRHWVSRSGFDAKYEPTGRTDG